MTYGGAGLPMQTSIANPSEIHPYQNLRTFRRIGLRVFTSKLHDDDDAKGVPTLGGVPSLAAGPFLVPNLTLNAP